MKVHALALVLAIFTGSLASVPVNERRSLFIQLYEDVEGFVGVVASATVEEVNWLESLKSIQELRQQIVNDYYKAGEYLEQLLKKSPPEVQELTLRVQSVAGTLLTDTTVKLVAIKDHINLVLRVYAAPYAEPILEKMRGQAEALSARIQVFTRQEKERQKLQLDEEKSHAADIETCIRVIHFHWLKFKESLEPWADCFQEYFFKGMDILKPYLASVRQAPEGHARE